MSTARLLSKITRALCLLREDEHDQEEDYDYSVEEANEDSSDDENDDGETGNSGNSGITVDSTSGARNLPFLANTMALQRI